MKTANWASASWVGAVVLFWLVSSDGRSGSGKLIAGLFFFLEMIQMFQMLFFLQDCSIAICLQNEIVKIFFCRTANGELVVDETANAFPVPSNIAFSKKARNSRRSSLRNEE